MPPRQSLLLILTYLLVCAGNACCAAEHGSPSQVDYIFPGNEVSEEAQQAAGHVQQPAPEPSPDENADLLSVSADESVVPVLERPPNSSNVTVIGQLASVSQQHFDLLGGSDLTLQLEQLPWNVSHTRASCAFLPYNRVAELRSQALMDSGIIDPTFSEVTRSQYFDLAIQSQLSSAALAILPTIDCKPSDDSCPDALYNFTAKCSVPQGSSPVVPVVLLQSFPTNSDDDVLDMIPLWSIVGNGSWARLTPAGFQALAPTVGPASGHTSITIEGHAFQTGLQCVFVNGTAQPTELITVNATQVSPSSARCSSPQWPLGNATSLWVAMELRWPDGFQLPAASFSYARDPVISALKSDVLRYGGGGIVAGFNFSFAELASSNQALKLQPMLRLQRPGVNGRHVDLPAQFSKNMSSLSASMPVAGDQKPSLGNGSWLVRASINGGHDFCVASNDTNSVLEVSGPTVSMRVAYYQLHRNQQTVTLHAYLRGGRSGMRPVSVVVTMDQRSASGTDALDGASVSLKSATLYWDSGSNVSQPILLTLPTGNQFDDRAVVVKLEKATNADVSPDAQTTIVSRAPRADFRISFKPAANKVLYPRTSARITISIKPGRIPAPGAVLYTLKSLTPAGHPFIAGVDGADTGVLAWDPAQGASTQLKVPVEWSQVPLEAVYRVGLSLQPAWNAEIANVPQQPALHIFGVLPGTCPPGTFSKTKPRTPHPQLAASSLMAVDGFLRQLSLLQPNGTPFELSTEFRPNTTLYGAMIPTDVPSATLCIEPVQRGGQVAVFDPLLRVVPSLNDSAVATFSALAKGDRRLMQLGGISGCSVNQAAYRLPLHVGQNPYEIYITTLGDEGANGAVLQQAPPIMTHSDALAAVRDASNHTMRYSMAAVRAAVPAHARLATLNATINNGGNVQVLPVCGTPIAATAAANNEARGAAAQPPLQEGAGGGKYSFMASLPATVPCSPDTVMNLAVSFETTYLSLHPGLLYPNLQGIRVEVNGQVLNQGGNLGADRITDTTSRMQERQDPGFLPPAVIIGLQPLIPLQVPVVIVAEDGVTSLRYYVAVVRAGASPPPPPTFPPPPAAVPTRKDTTLYPGGGSADAVSELASVAASPLAEALSGADAPGDLAHLVVSAPQPKPASEVDPETAEAFDNALKLSAAAKALMEPPPPGWPMPPAQSPNCGACIGGWASTTANATYCTMCQPGTYAASAFAPECAPCAKGTYGSSWGSTHCRHCVTGTYGPRERGQMCLMCPTNFTTEADGSSECTTPVGKGTDLTSRYAVVVSFGVLLNGTALEDIARRAGVNATSSAILDTLVRLDTASAFNVSLGDVHVIQVKQLSNEVLHVKVSAALPVEIPDGASPDDVRTAFNVKSISADEPIQMLITDPDKFFGRTTKALNVDAEGDGKGARRTLSSPSHGHRLALEWPAILGIIVGGIVMAVLSGAVFARKRTRRAYQAFTARLDSIRWRGARRGWPIADVIQRQGSGSSVATTASDATSPATNGVNRARGRPADRILPRTHADSAAELA